MNEVTMRAHGRVNLIGEHTDYNGGWVLPTTIPQYTEVTVSKNVEDSIHLVSHRESGKREGTYKLGKEVRSGTWTDYLQGATKILSEQFELGGFKANIFSTIPEGSGLSSSAALEMSFLKAVREFFNLPISETELALLGQRIENEFVGARVGIMDQMATSLASEGEALYLDTLNLSFERVPLPLSEIDLLVINSGITHKLSAHDGGYNERRAQCEEAAALLGMKTLREATLKDLEMKNLPPLLFRRAKHVVTENGRVHEAVKAIKEKNHRKLGELFSLSHTSMRDDFQVSIPEIDILVRLLSENKEVYGARLTGGGFGGSVVAITQKGKKHKIAEEALLHYEKETGAKGKVLV